MHLFNGFVKDYKQAKFCSDAFTSDIIFYCTLSRELLFAYTASQLILF